MFSPIEFYKALRNGGCGSNKYTTNIKIYQSRQTLDYNGAPMFEIELTSKKTREPNPNDPYDCPYEFEITLKQNPREIEWFVVGVKLSNLRWKTAGETEKELDKLKRVMQDLIDDCKNCRGPGYNSRSEYSAYKTISGCYQRLSLHFERLHESYGAHIARIDS